MRHQRTPPPTPPRFSGRGAGAGVGAGAKGDRSVGGGFLLNCG
ncbi:MULTISPECIES: hypothetical protein [Cyanophyceae]|nr:hypothetical protein [Coleofasciculus sp. FACHB-125]